MSRRRATLKDVAEAIGVHVSTVSRALHAKTRHLITDELAERIVAAADALDYRPNPIAFSLRTRRSMTIGVLVPDITNPIFPPIVRGVEDVLVSRGYTALVVNTDNDPAKAANHIQMLRGRGVDGLIVASAQRRDPTLAEVVEDGLPLIAVNRMPDRRDISAVVNDERAGIGAVVDHLAGLGHRRIAHIAGPQALSTGFARCKAFRACVAARGLDRDPDLIVTATRFGESEGERCAGPLLDLSPPPTAIVAANDLLALGAIRALTGRGLSSPQDISVTGFNDMPFFDRLTPPLTTVRIQSYETGRRAAAMILQHIETPLAQRTAQTEILGVELIERGSTGPARQAPGSGRARGRQSGKPRP